MGDRGVIRSQVTWDRQMPITKLDAARRQLSCAIEVFFNDGDSLSIQTLAHAAFKLLYDLYGKSRSDDYLDRMNGLLTPLGWKKLTEVPNFLKHADRDHDTVLDDHKSESVIATIGMACMLYGRLSFDLTPEMQAFDDWARVRSPDLFRLPPDPDAEFEAAYRDAVELLAKAPWDVQIMGGKAALTVYKENPHFLTNRKKQRMDALEVAAGSA